MSQPKETSRANAGTWKPGQSGNPGGRSGEIVKLRAKLAKGADAVTKVVLERAKAGDMQACRLILERIVPAIKPTAETVRFTFTGETATDQAQSIMAAIAAGEIPPDQGKALIEALASVAKIAEIDELTRRLDALEART